MNRILTPLIAVLAVTSAHATPILTWTGGDYVASAFQQTIGWNFAANQTLQIANLEWYDPTGTNPTQHTVDIWSMDGTLVSSVCVGSGCASSSYLSGFWQTPVSLTLAPGTYDIGGWVDVGDSFLWKGTTVSADPSITYNLPVYIHSTSDLFPGTSTSCGSVGCFGPNFSVAQATPEPGSLVLMMLGLVMAAAMAMRRRGVSPRCSRGSALALVTLLASASGLLRANTFQNGSFELPATTSIGFGVAPTGWVLTEGSNENTFLQADSYFGVPVDNGPTSFGFGGSGTTGATLAQTFDTGGGDGYSVVFDYLAQQDAGTPPPQEWQVQLIDAASLTVLASETMTFINKTWVSAPMVNFIATGASTTLLFTDLTSVSNSGPVNWALDNVIVTQTSGPAVPEPGTSGLLGVALVLGLAYLAVGRGVRVWRGRSYSPCAFDR